MQATVAHSCSAAALTQRRAAAPKQLSQAAAKPSARRQAVRVRAEGEGAPATGIETKGPNMTALKEIQEIMSILPHRYPFLLVDRVLEWEYGKYAVGYKCVTINDNFFPGHFPQRAIMPGVLQVEAMAQLGGIIMIDPANAAQQTNFFFGGVDNLRWRKPVVPGDVLMMRCDVTKFNKRFGICKMSAKAYVGEDLVCEAELTLVMQPEK
ncbi:beta-hydroxyacyl-ACP dehydratase [Chlorella sorokiniana]|jgi:3-hydroxyacyl-[acyl-carrier-protein] dehydratase|uniref:3-hydroxyacyl-[acyl-carrier-protein] dehydratase n=1 Tax=Chlorella sorokiniana TaxID=3076 RepID=A0A2P6TST2_CHLSO|nr:beta-hydroxyacyl-ACP dehydratase [Chlorella sorokiniana]|eukprot:PRW57104.1 beta-hydroxyacyl-ACP dehydratase [Chlorella sorokiniana]